MKFRQDPTIGRGFLLKDRRLRNIRAPQYRGRLKLPRDYKKGHTLSIVAWVTKDKRGNAFISLEINTQKIIRKHIRDAMAKAKAEREFQKTLIQEKAQYEKGLWPPKPKPVPYVPKPPTELKRKDVL